MAFTNLLCKGIRLYIIAFAVLSLTAVALAQTGPKHNKVVVCYLFPEEFASRGKDEFKFEKFPFLCTHVIYAFVPMDGIKDTLKDKDKEVLTTGLKKRYPHLKVGIAIGGRKANSMSFSTLASDPLQRDRFVKESSNFLTKNGFDELNLYWEYPTRRGGQAKDRENFMLLVKELREEFDKHNLLLTSVIAAKKDIIDEAYDVRQLSKYLDYLYVQSYDYHGSWDNKVGFNAPLTAISGDVLSVQYTIDYLIKMGAPPSKIVLGLPFYGRSFTTAIQGEIDDDTIDSEFGGPYSREKGFLGYNEICSMLSDKNSTWSSRWDATASEVIARSEEDDSIGLIKVVTFDNSRSIANKVLFAMKKLLAGVSVKSVDTDDFFGECEPANDTFMDFKRINFPKPLKSTYPLLRTVNEATIYALEEIEMEQQLEQQLVRQTQEQQLKEQTERKAEQQLVRQTEEQQLKEQTERKVEQQLVRQTEEQQSEKHIVQEVEHLMKQDGNILKQQKKKPAKNMMNNLVCFLTIPKRCFLNE